MGRIVIVGAGSAGAVMAARITEVQRHEVVLVEAGPDYPDPARLPADLVDGTRNSMTQHDWGYHHRPTAGQAPFVFPRGRVVGGSSAVNTCIALRGQRWDFDEWAALGLPEWSFERCLPAFRRLETDLDHPGPAHGADGPIRIRRHPQAELVPWQRAFLEGCAALGFPRCDDSNDPDQPIGYGPHAMNKIAGARQSAALCYLTPAVRARPHLTLMADTLVRRVLFRDRAAVGVEVEQAGEVRRLDADHVILAGGAINTPGILLRSGVGPSAAVARLAVEPVADVPGVAARLLDHPGAAFVMIPEPGVSDPSHPLIQTVLRFTSTGSEHPGDMQLQPGSHLPYGDTTYPFVTLMCCVGKPRGHGALTWTSADPRARPRIDSRVMEHPDDRRRAAEALELGWLVARSAAPSQLRRAFFFPGERVLTDRQALLDVLPRISGSGYHPSGTVPMGPEGDPGAATDQHGRVRGVRGLTVADASLMPTIPSSNTNLTTLMIGERFGAWFADGTLGA